MAIIYNPNKKIFTLHTAHTTYQMQVDPLGYLLHLYYGEKTNSSMDYVLTYADRGFSGNPYAAGMDRTYSLDALPQEYPSLGTGDYRNIALNIKNEKGVESADLLFKSYEIQSGKYQLQGLPAVWADENEAQTLEIVLADENAQVEVHLLYGVLEETDVITRSVRIKNMGTGQITIEKAAAACLDFVRGDFDVLRFYGKHAMERNLERTPLGHGTIALITYLRTDSTRISDEAAAAAKDYIIKNFGEDYIAGIPRADKPGKKIQDAHEAIRPTDITLSPAAIKDQLSREQFRLYQLIYNRFLASQMAEAVYSIKTVKAEVAGYRFQTSVSKIAFAGFTTVYNVDNEKSEHIAGIKDLNEGDLLKLEDFDEKQHFTQPPARYTEALLVRTLEELGIGRPSTYAPTISTILNRRYITKENKKLYVTELGEAVNQIMEQAFPVIIDVNFTANLESLLDKIGEGAIEWKVVVRNFYPDLDAAVKKAESELQSIKIEDEVTDEVCDECGRNMVVKYGPHGKFLACPGFPDCKFTKPFFEKTGVPCPKCGGDIVIKKTRKGRRYYGCINAPECDFMSWAKPSREKCPVCGSYMVEKGNKLLCSAENCGYSRDNTEKEK